jgi:hypothetical protein
MNSPFELVQWAIAGMFSLILLGIGLSIAEVLIVSAVRSARRGPTVVNLVGIGPEFPANPMVGTRFVKAGDEYRFDGERWIGQPHRLDK